MEWIQTTGKTVEEALEAALDELGVDAADAEYEVMEEPKTGLFGRLRTEARIRARVRPTTPRPKEERRSRAKRPAASKSAAEATTGEPAAQPATQDPAPRRQDRTPRRNTAKAASGRPAEREQNVNEPQETVPLADQGALAAAFVQGVVERFGATTATVDVHTLDEETVEVRVEGSDLGLLIGPKGTGVQSLQELTRSAVQRSTGARSGRILVDVGGYRQRRKVELKRFAEKIAADVLAGGSPIAFEPMNPADRKIIHDTINDIDGVTTTSTGEEPQRRVVVSPS